MINTILKIIFLLLAIMYGFSNVVKAFKGLEINDVQIMLMAIGIVGFIAFQLEWLAF